MEDSLKSERKRIMKADDYYSILNVSNTATEAEIKSAYKKLALKFHPDKAGEEYKETFQKVNEAYENLVNTDKRSFYDRYGKDSEEKLAAFFTKLATHFNKNDIFNFLFCLRFKEEVERRDKRYKESKEEKEQYNDKLKKYFMAKFGFTLILIIFTHICIRNDLLVSGYSKNYDFCENRFWFPIQSEISGSISGKEVKISFCHVKNFALSDKRKAEIIDSKIVSLKAECGKFMNESKSYMNDPSKYTFQAFKAKFTKEFEACSLIKEFNLNDL